MSPDGSIFDRPRRVRQIGNTYSFVIAGRSEPFFGPWEEFWRTYPDLYAAMEANPEDARFVMSPLLAGPLTVIGRSRDMPISQPEARMITLANAEDSLGLQQYIDASRDLWHPRPGAGRPWVALHLSCWMGLDDLVARLAQAMPECVSAAGHLDMTALHWAACGGSVSTANVLLARGADPAALNLFTWSAADIAHHNHYAELGRVVIAAGSPPHGVSFRRMLDRLAIEARARIAQGRT